MHQEIKEHILEGHLKLAFEEIAALDLSRDQRDELLKVEARYNRLQRESSQMTSELRGIESERLNDRVLKLINWISDEAKGPKKPVASPIKTSSNEATSSIATPAVKSGPSKLPYLIIGGLLLLLVGGIWASGILESAPQKTEPKVIEKQEAPHKTDPQKPAPSSTATLNLEAIKNAAKIPIEKKPTSIAESLSLKKPSVSLYVKLKNFADQDGGERIRRQQEIFQKLSANAKDFTLNSQSLLSLGLNYQIDDLVAGTYKGGPIQGINGNYFAVVGASGEGSGIYAEKIKFRLSVYRNSDGKLLLSKQYENSGSQIKASTMRRLFNDLNSLFSN